MKRKLIIPVVIVMLSSLSVGCTTSMVSTNSNKNTQTIEKQLEIQTKAISGDNDALQSNINLPIFSGGNKEELLNEINNIIEEDTLKLREELAKMAESDFEDAKKAKIDFRIYELLIDYEVHTANNELISLTTLNYQYTGGAHGLSVKVPYNFDLTTGKEIALSDLFKEGSDYRKVLNEEIQRQIKEDPDKFFPDEVEVFSGISKDQAFYIEDGKLIIYFGQYDIAPYASGIIEFEIPNNILKDIIVSPLIIN